MRRPPSRRPRAACRSSSAAATAPRSPCDIARRAEAAGADGILLLPPYLVNASRRGWGACRGGAAATRLGVIVYNRDNAILDDVALARLADRCPNLVGFKDGVGDIELMVRIQSRLEGRLIFIGGLPTAETFALPYLDLGVEHLFLGDLQLHPGFREGLLCSGSRPGPCAVMQGLRDFVLPYIAIRNRRKGYAVSIVKAGLRVVGRGAGPVRAPLVELRDNEMAELSDLVARVSPHGAAKALQFA